MAYCHRLAAEDDLPAIVDIYNSAIPAKMSTCDLEPVTVGSRQAWFAASSPDRYPIWVGYEQDRPQTVTGYFAFDHFLNGRRGYDATSEVAVYLHPDHRGKGQGGYLLREAIEHAPALRLRTLVASILAGNNASVRLFGAHGFQQWGRLPGVADLDGVVHDLLFLGRPVAAPAA